MSFSEETKRQLSPYVTSFESSVFALKNLPEEVVAVLFAYYSRSQKGLRENLLALLADQSLGIDTGSMAPRSSGELTLAQDKARAFHEKWVVGYGHASVAEHAVVHLALEDISIVASKVVEDMRLASYTEKSTRYVQFETGHCHVPKEVLGTPQEAIYRDAMSHLFEVYSSLIEPLTQKIVAQYPPKPGQRPRAVERACRAKALDALRALLPASTKTNVGLTLNGRAAAHLISKLKSHPLKECQELGHSMTEEAVKVLPTLVKYADKNAYFHDTPKAIEAMYKGFFPEEERGTGEEPAVSLGELPECFEDELVAAIFYRYANVPMSRARKLVASLTREQGDFVLSTYLKDRGPHDAPLRELEHVYTTSDIMVDYGAFRDIQRHRMATQTPQRLGVKYGYVVPDQLVKYGFEAPFREAMERAAQAYQQLVSLGADVASYVVPLAYRIRCIFTWNIRELFHFIELRSAPQGHQSYRRVAQALYHQFAETSPDLARHIRVTLDEGDLGRLKSEERAEKKREALAAKGIKLRDGA